jgi:hypothetical protein
MADLRPPAELERGGGGRAPPVNHCPHPRHGSQEEDDDAVDREADGGGFAVVMARRLSAAELTRGSHAVGCGAHALCLVARCLVAHSSSAGGLRSAIGGATLVAAQRD